jgi:hypothetical protein
MSTPSEHSRVAADPSCPPGASPLALRLGAAQFLRLPHPRGLRLQARAGHLWITVDGQLRDIALAPGRCHVFDEDAPALVSVFGDGAEFLAWRPAEQLPQAQPVWALA